MKRPLKNTTYEDAVAYAATLFEEFKNTNDFIEISRRAEALGVNITASPRHTYTDEFATRYVPTGNPTGQLPVGYAMELWFDITRDGRVLVTEGETPLQCSVGAIAIESCLTLISNRLNFYSLDCILENNALCAMLEEFLDAIEEGAAPSPFVTDAMCPVKPNGDADIVTREDVLGGAYVEFSCTPYDGTFGAESSLYVPADASLAYRLFLHAATKRSRDFEGDHLTLDSLETHAFIELLDAVEEELPRAVCFSDLLASLSDTPLAPTPRAEQLLDAVTTRRKNAFIYDCNRLADLARDCIDSGLTVIW